MLAAVWFALFMTVGSGVLCARHHTPQVVYQQDYVQQYATPYIGIQQQPANYQSPYIQYVQPQQQVYSQPQQVHSGLYKSSASSSALSRNYQVQQPQWAIVRQSLDNNFDGHFQYDYETENGISQQAVGVARQLSAQEVGQGIQGSYSYTAPDGRQITTSYTADENGFRAFGDHLPVAPQEPELPPLIAKSLAYIRSLPPQPENQQ